MSNRGMSDELVFDSKKYKFKCLQCGTCCRTLSTNALIGSMPNFNHKGIFVKNPKYGVCIFYSEIDEMRQNLTQEQLLKINSGTTIFLKDYPVGFTAFYQIRYNRYGHCSFFDFRTKKCDIYNFRPLTCRLFPIMFYQEVFAFGDNVLNRCKAILSEIAHQNSISIKDVDVTQDINFSEFSNKLRHCFPPYKQEKLKILYSFTFFKRVVEYFVDMLLPEEQTTLNTIKKYKLLDFKDFVKWFRANIKNKLLLERLNKFIPNNKRGGE